jgi:hypothetical protein
MNCPTCHLENVSEAVTCPNCGRPLHTSKDRPVRRSASRRRNSRNGDAAEAAVDNNNPEAWRAYRLSLWAVVPGLGLLLGPVATVLGCRALRTVGDDFSAHNRAKAAIFFGVVCTLTQWLGIALIYSSWS